MKKEVLKKQKLTQKKKPGSVSFVANQNVVIDGFLNKPIDANEKVDDVFNSLRALRGC